MNAHNDSDKIPEVLTRLGISYDNYEAFIDVDKDVDGIPAVTDDQIMEIMQELVVKEENAKEKCNSDDEGAIAAMQ